MREQEGSRFAVSMVVATVMLASGCRPEPDTSLDALVLDSDTVAREQAQLAQEAARVEAERLEKERAAAGDLDAERLAAEAQKEAVRRSEEAERAASERAKLVGTRFGKIVTSSGKIYTEVTVKEINDLELKLAHDAGIAMVKLPDLSPEFQQRFFFDEARYLEMREAYDIGGRQQALALEAARTRKANHQTGVAVDATGEAGSADASKAEQEVARLNARIAQMRLLRSQKRRIYMQGGSHLARSRAQKDMEAIEKQLQALDAALAAALARR
ncbi:MAG: hypothetical protein ACC661_05730 [Verrucomicrobiales bacterium]